MASKFFDDHAKDLADARKSDDFQRAANIVSNAVAEGPGTRAENTDALEDAVDRNRRRG